MCADNCVVESVGACFGRLESALLSDALVLCLDLDGRTVDALHGEVDSSGSRSAENRLLVQHGQNFGSKILELQLVLGHRKSLLVRLLKERVQLLLLLLQRKSGRHHCLLAEKLLLQRKQRKRSIRKKKKKKKKKKIEKKPNKQKALVDGLVTQASLPRSIKHPQRPAKKEKKKN